MNRNHRRVEGVFNRKATLVAIIFSGVLGASGVALGAWAAHGLEASHGRHAVELVDTAVRYQLVHAVAVCAAVALAYLLESRPGVARCMAAGAWLFVIGAALFCGALHALAFGAPRWLGMVAPIGGLALVGGWLAVALGGWLARRSID
ncbi:MAG: DUF423 domain-containing protein [Alphaproteobacteria bacterium]|nr:DUF423 domain-containing protein [Alphaproteobacteria bacterium]